MVHNVDQEGRISRRVAPELDHTSPYGPRVTELMLAQPMNGLRPFTFTVLSHVHRQGDLSPSTKPSE